MVFKCISFPHLPKVRDERDIAGDRDVRNCRSHWVTGEIPKKSSDVTVASGLASTGTPRRTMARSLARSTRLEFFRNRSIFRWKIRWKIRWFQSMVTWNWRQMASNTALGRYFFDRLFSAVELLDLRPIHVLSQKPQKMDLFSSWPIESTHVLHSAFETEGFQIQLFALHREPERTGLLAKVVNSNRFGGLCMMASHSREQFDTRLRRNWGLKMRWSFWMQFSSLLCHLDLKFEKAGNSWASPQFVWWSSFQGQTRRWSTQAILNCHVLALQRNCDESCLFRRTNTVRLDDETCLHIAMKCYEAMQTTWLVRVFAVV